MSCKIKFRKNGQTALITVEGNLTGPQSGKLTQKVKKLCTSKFSRVAVELSGLSIIDSHGLGALIYCMRELKGCGKELLIVKPNNLIAEMFQRTNLDKVFSFIDSIENL